MADACTATVVDDPASLAAAIDAGAERISVRGAITGLPPLRLKPGQSLAGEKNGASLSFNTDGVVLSRDNRLERLELFSPPSKRAIMVAVDAASCGTMILCDLACHGLVQLVFSEHAGDVALRIARLEVTMADATQCLPRPTGNGVEVQQGALTIWNRSPATTVVTIDAQGIVIGSAEAPVGGTGLFVAGQGDAGGGKVCLHRFHTGSVHSDSRLPEGTTHIVAGGMFFFNGVEGDVLTHGDIITHGPNAVPVDTWGTLGLWRIEGNARSHGPSAVGFVNAGQLGRCEITGVLETFGDGARGCCIYGPTGSFSADSIRTHGRAAAGVQVVASLERLELGTGIFTQGDAGEGLMKGQMVRTPAHGVEVEAGGALGVLDCASISVTGSEAEPIHAQGMVRQVARPRF